MPYLISLVVISWPFCIFRPFLMVKVQVRPSSETLPVSLARSPTSSTGFPSTRRRPTRRRCTSGREVMGRDWLLAGSQLMSVEELSTVRVPPFLAVADAAAPTLSEELAPHAASTKPIAPIPDALSRPRREILALTQAGADRFWDISSPFLWCLNL